MKAIARGASMLAAWVFGLAGCGSGGTVEQDIPPPPTYTVSGFVNATSGPAVAGVTIALSGTRNGSTLSSSGGYYSFSDLPNGSYTLTPTRAGYTFSPPSLLVVVSNANVSDRNFTASGGATYGISGTVSGAVSAGVTVTLSSTPNQTTITDASGAYAFAGLVDATYGVTPSLVGYTFFPVSHTVVVNGASVTGRDFVATRVP